MPSDVEPFIGELRLMSFNFPPKGWAFCNGQLLPINQNQALFSLFGTTYGGNGQTTFALPDLRGRVPLHVGSGHSQGQSAGQESHALTTGELPSHVHRVQASSSDGNQAAPATLAAAGNLYRAPTDLTGLRADTVGNYGGSQPHQNMSPFLTLSWCVALQGIFPSRN